MELVSTAIRESEGERTPGTTRRPAAGVQASDGSRAVVEANGGREVLRVSDGAGRLLFEHFPAEGRSVVHAPAGDLDFVASGQVRLRGTRVALEAAEDITAEARRAEVRVEEGRLHARTTSVVVEHATQAIVALELSVGRLVERAAEVYRSCEGLAETRAGRLRLLAEKTLHLLGERALLKTREEVKVKGEKIYLG